MSEGDKEGRTEAATPKRLQQAREEGRAPVSRELPMAAGLAATVLVLIMSAPHSGRQLARSLQALLLMDASPGQALRDAAMAGLLAIGPLLAAILVASLAVGFFQTGGLVSFTLLKPSFAKLNPASGLARLFGLNNLIESAKSVVKLGLLGFVAWHALSSVLPALPASILWQPETVLDRMLRLVLHLFLSILAGQAVISGADLLWTRFRHARDLRMSREEVKQENRDSEGDPHIKGRLKQMRLARTRKRMMAAVPNAMVVVTNPTHYAVALAYDTGQQAAPRVVAKGMDEVAARIRAIAQENGVPLVANPPLARALFRVELDAEIPAEQFQAVAEIIAYVWRLKGRVQPLR